MCPSSSRAHAASCRVTRGTAAAPCEPFPGSPSAHALPGTPVHEVSNPPGDVQGGDGSLLHTWEPSGLPRPPALVAGARLVLAPRLQGVVSRRHCTARELELGDLATEREMRFPGVIRIPLIWDPNPPWRSPEQAACSPSPAPAGGWLPPRQAASFLLPPSRLRELSGKRFKVNCQKKMVGGRKCAIRSFRVISIHRVV